MNSHADAVPTRVQTSDVCLLPSVSGDLIFPWNMKVLHLHGNGTIGTRSQTGLECRITTVKIKALCVFDTKVFPYFQPLLCVHLLTFIQSDSRLHDCCSQMSQRCRHGSTEELTIGFKQKRFIGGETLNETSGIKWTGAKGFYIPTKWVVPLLLCCF